MTASGIQNAYFLFEISQLDVPASQSLLQDHMNIMSEFKAKVLSLDRGAKINYEIETHPTD